jgi:hypothetical protein
MTLRITGNSTSRTDGSRIEAAVQTIERTIPVPTPLARAWGYLVDFTNTEERDPPTETTTRVAGAPTSQENA